MWVVPLALAVLHDATSRETGRDDVGFLEVFGNVRGHSAQDAHVRAKNKVRSAPFSSVCIGVVFVVDVAQQACPRFLVLPDEVNEFSGDYGDLMGVFAGAVRPEAGDATFGGFF